VAPEALALGGTGLFLWLFLRVQWRVGDEGSIVYNAARVAAGAVPYRDFFEVMGPGTFYLLAIWFKILGSTWLTSRIAVLATALLSASAIYYVARRTYRGGFAAVPAVLYTLVTVPLWPAASHHFDSNMWLLLALAVSVSSTPPSRTTLVSSGVLAGLASSVMLQKGVLFFSALCVARVIDNVEVREWRRAVIDTLWMVVPFVIVWAIIVVFFWSQNALSELVYANLIFPATRYRSINALPYAFGLRELAFEQFAPVFAAITPAPISHVATILAAVPLFLIAAVPAVAAALLLHGLLGRNRAAAQAARMPWCIWCTGFALFVSECHRADIYHLTYGSPILLIAVIGWAARVGGWVAVVSRRILLCGVVLLAAVLAVSGSRPHTTMRTRSGDIQVFRQDEALDFIHQNVPARGTLFVYPYYPMYYFLANVTNPTRYSILMYHYNAPEQFAEVIRDLEAGQVKYVLWDTWVAGANLTRWFPGYQDPPADEQPLEQYLNDHYRVIGVKNGFRILERM
jgi:hypothetical protein